MAVYAKPSDRLVRVSAEDSPDFIRRFNEHVITEEQIASCEKAMRLFERGKNYKPKEASISR